jgi:hypothetical protein
LGATLTKKDLVREESVRVVTVPNLFILKGVLDGGPFGRRWRVT